VASRQTLSSSTRPDIVWIPSPIIEPAINRPITSSPLRIVGKKPRLSADPADDRGSFRKTFETDDALTPLSTHTPTHARTQRFLGRAPGGMPARRPLLITKDANCISFTINKTTVFQLVPSRRSTLCPIVRTDPCRGRSVFWTRHICVDLLMVWAWSEWRPSQLFLVR
jgi:hypothetical protein